MYSRKQFFAAVAMRCIELIKTCNSIIICQEEESTDDSDEWSSQSIFLEAMRLGIDPGTLDARKLLQAVNDAREQN